MSSLALKYTKTILVIFALFGCATKDNPDTALNIDNYTLKKIDHILLAKASLKDSSQEEQIKIISSDFLGTHYMAHRLIGSAKTPEKLVIDFRGLDCFTYLDYIHSLRHSKNLNDFIKNLIQTRYINGKIAFANRKHFFTDWAYKPNLNTQDITSSLSPYAITVTKNLNQKQKGGRFLPSLKAVKRDVTYIPSRFIDTNLLKHLKTGDYIGIYTFIKGLDVTHTGLFVQAKKGPVFRNASSLAKNKKVVDYCFIQYIKKIPGIIVLRPLD